MSYILMNRRLIGLVAFILAMVIVAFVGPYFNPYKVEPQRWNYVPKDRPPSMEYPFGTTTLGQDVLWLTIYALRESFAMGFITAAISIAISLIVGSLAAYVRSPVASEVVASVIDAFCVMPLLPILITISLLWKQQLNPIFIGVILGVLGWGGFARIIRAALLSLQERPFVYVAKASGYGFFDLLIKVYTPQVIGWLIVAFINRIIFAIGMEASLGLFGLTSLNRASIGSIIHWSLTYQAFLRGIWWWYTFPIVLVVVTVVVLYLIVFELQKSLRRGVTL